MTPSDGVPPSRICVVDTNILIAMKNRLRVGEQWPMLRYLDLLVEGGWITFPKQVAGELEVSLHPDGPGIWAVDARKRRRYGEPSDDSMAEVLAVAPGLLDPNEERNQADPYVVAMAYELRERYPDVEVCVATENTVDRPPLVSPGTACAWLDIPRIDFHGFLKWLPHLNQHAAELVIGAEQALAKQIEADRAAGEARSMS